MTKSVSCNWTLYHSYIFKMSLLMLIPFHSLWSMGSWKLQVCSLPLMPYCPCFSSAVSRTTLVSLPLWVLPKCMPVNIADWFSYGVPNPGPLAPSNLNVHSCSVLSHKASVCLWWTVRIFSQKTAIWRLLLLLSTSLKKVAGGNYNIARALSHHDSGSHSYIYLGEWCAPPGKFWNSGCLEDYCVAFFAPITDFSEDLLTPIYKG